MLELFDHLWPFSSRVILPKEKSTSLRNCMARFLPFLFAAENDIRVPFGCDAMIPSNVQRIA